MRLAVATVVILLRGTVHSVKKCCGCASAPCRATCPVGVNVCALVCRNVGDAGVRAVCFIFFLYLPTNLGCINASCVVAATDCWLVCVLLMRPRLEGHSRRGTGCVAEHAYTRPRPWVFSPHLPLFFLCQAATYCRWRCGAAGTCLFNAKDLQADFATAMGTHTWSCATISLNA